MPDYFVTQITPSQVSEMQEVHQLLKKEGIRADKSLDYTCGIYDDEMNLIATGSCFGNTLRCMAVSSEHQGEGLMNLIVSHLVSIQADRGNTHLFLYTKCDSAEFFRGLGFYEITRIQGQIVFMENRRTGFSDYLAGLQKETEASPVIKRLSRDRGNEDFRTAALVMNANPFTLGHQYLVEQAAAENDILHLFIVSEDSSLVPFSVRRRLVMEGTAHLNNIVYHKSGPYIISNATFPSYFQKDSREVMESHANLDLGIFVQIAKRLSIHRRYVGEEPVSLVTGIYNDIMSEKLPGHGVDCRILPRKKAGDQFISASLVRQALKEQDMELLKNQLPRTSLDFFLSAEAEEVMEKIRSAPNVIHH